MDYIGRDAALDIDVDVEVENEADIDLIMRGMRIVIDHIKALPILKVEWGGDHE